MCHSFVGTLLSPPACSGEKGRLHECVCVGKINQYFLFIQFLVLIYSVFVCWEILSVDQWPTWWHYFASYRTTALSGAQTKTASAPDGLSVHGHECFPAPPWLCAVGQLMIEPFFLTQDLLLRYLMLKNLLLSVLHAVPCYSYGRLKSWEASHLFLRYQDRFIPWCNRAKCCGIMLGIALRSLSLSTCGGGSVCFCLDCCCKVERRNLSNASAICSCFGPSS